jgi:RHS repeat-associated protein
MGAQTDGRAFGAVRESVVVCRSWGCITGYQLRTVRLRSCLAGVSSRRPKTRTSGENPSPRKRVARRPRLEERGARFYSPGLGRWLSWDPMGEADGAGIYCFTANDSVNAVDWLGLLAISAVLDTDGHHASVETDSSVWISYIGNKTTPGSYQASHAGISTVFFAFSSGVYASIDAWTHQKGFLWPSSYFQMSNGIDGRMVVCGCCPDDKVWVSWTVSAEIRTSGYVPKKGVQGAQAIFDAHPATTASSASVRTHGGYGNDDPPVTVSGAGLYFLTPGTCLEFPMHLGQGWYEQDRTALGVRASSWIVATAECLLGF